MTTFDEMIKVLNSLTPEERLKLKEALYAYFDKLGSMYNSLHTRDFGKFETDKSWEGNYFPVPEIKDKDEK